MSVALEFPPTVYVPERARPSTGEGWAIPGGGGLATVRELRPPADDGTASLRLTRRGTVVLALAVAVLGLALVWLAQASAPSAAPSVGSSVREVTVRPGDTLWAIATRVAPGADPMAEVARLERVNHLSSVDLIPGQRIRLH